MRLFRKSGMVGGKYLVRRNDPECSVLEHPCIVLGGRDPCAPLALHAYASAANQRKHVGHIGYRNEHGYSVVRRDGSTPAWPAVVLHAADPCAPLALRAYAEACNDRGMDSQYVADIRSLAQEFEAYRDLHLPPPEDATSQREFFGERLPPGYMALYEEHVRSLAWRFEQYRNEHGDGDPDGAPHRTDDPQIIALMARCGSV
jgi:hypothetical protein